MLSLLHAKKLISKGIHATWSKVKKTWLHLSGWTFYSLSRVFSTEANCMKSWLIALQDFWVDTLWCQKIINEISCWAQISSFGWNKVALLCIDRLNDWRDCWVKVEKGDEYQWQLQKYRNTKIWKYKNILNKDTINGLKGWGGSSGWVWRKVINLSFKDKNTQIQMH